MNGIPHAIFAVILLLQITLAEVSAAIGVITSIVIALSVIAGVVWFVFKGKDIQALTAEVARKDSLIKDLQFDVSRAKEYKATAESDLAKEKADHAETKRQLKESEGRVNRSIEREEECEIEKKRLQGLIDAQNRGK